MSTSQIALDQLQRKGFPFWKLYKGKDRVAQCDADENPDGKAEIAVALFEEEIQARQSVPGTYTLNIYRRLKGDTGGTRYDFTISSHEPRPNFNQRPGMLSTEEIYARAKLDIETQQSLKRIEDKLDAIGEFILASKTDDKKDDDSALKMLIGLFGPHMKNKAVPAVAKNGFASLT